VPVTGELSAWTSAALDQRRDLAAARLKLEAGRLEEKVARSAFLPEVAVVGRYDLYDDVLFGANGGSGALMGVARINLFRGGADNAALAAARYDTTAFTSNVRRFEEGVMLETRQAWHDLETAGARRSTASASLAAAREALTVREARFRQGLDKMIDLLDAETTLREAEVRELVARYDLSLAAYRLRFSSGASVIDLVLLSEE
jgi:outer membrane protein TolC